MFSQVDLARAAFAALGKPAKITLLPDWLRRAALILLPRPRAAADRRAGTVLPHSPGAGNGRGAAWQQASRSIFHRSCR